MSEKRRPSHTIIASKPGKKRMKIELYRASLWPKKFAERFKDQYRVRINGRWANGDRTWTMTDFVDQFRRWMVK